MLYFLPINCIEKCIYAYYHLLFFHTQHLLLARSYFQTLKRAQRLSDFACITRCQGNQYKRVLRRTVAHLLFVFINSILLHFFYLIADSAVKQRVIMGDEYSRTGLLAANKITFFNHNTVCINYE
jgi:hypothetical protein